jgi:hypothetical membrane protein
MNYQRVAGALLFVAAAVSILGIVTAEATYPGYNVKTNFISDLGATRPPESLIKQPASTIFAATLAINGLLWIGGAYCVYRGLGPARGVTALSILLALSGICAVVVAAFNQSTVESFLIHMLFALPSFVAAGLAVIVSYWVLRAPFRYFALILGIIVLVSFMLLIFGESSSVVKFIGSGGIESWVVYPLTLWSAGFGAYLMGQASSAGALEWVSDE